MTLDPTLIDTVNANLPNLDVPDLAALRAAALPIFVAWAKAVKLPDASGTLQVVDPAAGHSDVAILLNTDPNGNVTVDDFGYQVTDAGGSYWTLASGGLSAWAAVVGVAISRVSHSFEENYPQTLQGKVVQLSSGVVTVPVDLVECGVFRDGATSLKARGCLV